MNGIELFEQIKQVSTFAELLQPVEGKTKSEVQSKCGNIYEKVWDIIIKFGFLPILSNDEYNHFEGKFDDCKLKKVDNLEKYLQKLNIFSRNKGGSSDITLQHKLTKKWIFISSKFYADDSTKYINEYDVEKIVTVIKEHSHKYGTYAIYLLVNDKQKVFNMIESSQNKNIKKNIHHILDVSDLEIGFQKLKCAIQDISFDKINDIFCNPKIPLILRFHQDLHTYIMMLLIIQGLTEFLLGAKPRSGKTYCVGGLFIKYYKKYGVLNALIITPAPTETLSQFTDDLFHKFRDFIGINIIEIKKGSDLNNMILQQNNIIIVSKQLLDDYVGEKTIQSIKNLNLNFIVFDENHHHGTTQMSDNILQSYSLPKTIKWYLTGTFEKSLRKYNIPLECRLYWDIEDEQLGKQRDIQGLVDKHGKDVLLFLNEENKEEVLKIYDEMPDLHMITNIMDRDRYEGIKTSIKDTSYGFSYSTLLCGDFPGEVDTKLAYITGSNKERDYPNGDLSIFGRIKQICKKYNSRTKLNNGDFTSQLWFLPYGANMTIDKVSEHVMERMLLNPILKKYAIHIVNSKKKYKLKDLKEEIKNWELKAKKEGKDGLILLAGNQLTLGITLPFVDIVFLLNDTISSDKIFQMMFRAMTENLHSVENDEINSGRKRMGFVVDLNISRVLNTILDYKIYKKDLNTEQKITYLIQNNLINIDSDLFESKENKTKLVEKLLHIWKSDPINHLKILLRKIEDEIIDLDTKDQKILNTLFKSANSDKNVNIKVHFDEESKQDGLATGKKLVKNKEEKEEKEKEEDVEEEEEDKNISLTKDVLQFVIPLIIILTIYTKHKDILEMLNVIKTNPTLLSVFRDQSFIWWNKPDIIKFIEAIIVKYVKKNSIIYNISIQFKMSLHNLIDKPKELLELIHNCLKTKQKEKQENGEVFTPMNIVFELLDNLDNKYMKKNGKSIFSELHFKWFDPASGMGNFPVAVYLRLMDGLKQQIPNDEERKKHIIENMLYMSEINKKNVFICHQIFNINNQYKMNIYEGDTLALDITNVWGIRKFNVILGNPPYNKGGIRSHTGKQLGDINETIWTKFIEISFEWLELDGFLVFINPLSWLKKSHSLHNKLLDKFIIWLKLWDNSQSKTMIQADIPISLSIIQNTPNKTTRQQTEITSILKRRGLTTTSFEYLNPENTIPLAFHNIFNKLVYFIETNHLQLEYKTKTVKSTGTKMKIPTEYRLEDMWAVDTYTIKEGLIVKKVLEHHHHPDANKRKLIIANKASFAGAFIDEGNLSLTGNHKFYILGNKLELMNKILGFRISNIICHYTKYGQDFLDTEAFRYIPDIRKLEEIVEEDITEDEFYKIIGFTELEIEQIKS